MRVSKNAYYHWVNNKDSSLQHTAKAGLMDRITYHFTESKEIYGSHRIQKALEREGVFYCRSYVALLMKEMGLRSVLKKAFVVTTDSTRLSYC